MSAEARPRRLPLTAAKVKHGRVSLHPPHRTDPAEENDADDEGEIWYNPIPEDEEADPVIRVQTRRADADERQTQEESRATGTAYCHNKPVWKIIIHICVRFGRFYIIKH